jgi:hypothetical protein
MAIGFGWFTNQAPLDITLIQIGRDLQERTAEMLNPAMRYFG